MKICIAGKNNIAVDVCRYLENIYGKDLLCVVPNHSDTGKDTFQRSLLAYARQRELSIVKLDELYNLNDLLFLSLEFDRLIRPENFASDRLFNIHFSLLPEYKGMYTSALPILHGKERTGVTLHKIDQGIDTGDIIGQREISIDPIDTARSLYLKYIENGTALVLSNIDNLIKNKYRAFPQPSVNSFYYSKKSIDYGHLSLDVQVTAWQLACQVRAFVFRYYQLPEFAGYKLIGSEMCSTKSCKKPGSILEDTEDYIRLSTIDYDIKLIKDQFDRLLFYSETNNLTKIKSMNYLSYYLMEQNHLGWTSLMVAAYHHSREVFKYLLSLGADIHMTNYKGTTVLMYAKEGAIKSSDYELIDILLDKNIDVYRCDYSGKNVLDYLENKDNKLLRYLLNKI